MPEGGSVATVSVTASGGGFKATSGGAESQIDVIASGEGSKAVAGGSEASIDVLTSGGGTKTAFGGSEASIDVITTTHGVRGNIFATPVTIIVTTTGGGKKATKPGYQLWMPDPQAFAIDQERFRHDEALAMFGEYTMFVLMWNIEDFEQGLVTRCSECYLTYGKIAETYGQSSKKKCPSCFGTTLEGGYRAKIIRPSIWDATEDSELQSARGQVTRQAATIQSTSDFRLRVGDYIFRGDGTRWLTHTLSTNHLRTGFDMPNSIETPLGYNYGEVRREEDTSVAFIIDPADLSILDLPFQRYPVDWSAQEEILGYLSERP